MRQTEAAIFLRHLDSKRANFRQTFEIFGWNFTGAIDLIRIDIFAQITFQFLQKFFACSAVLGGLRRIRVNPIKIVTADKQVTGETATVLERIAGRFGELKRFALTFRHLRRVDDRGYRPFWLRAGFLSDLFFGSFQWGFHIDLSFRAKSRNLWI